MSKTQLTTFVLLVIVIPLVSTLLFGFTGFAGQLLVAFLVSRKIDASMYGDGPDGIFYGGLRLISLALGQVAAVTVLVISWFL